MELMRENGIPDFGIEKARVLVSERKTEAICGSGWEMMITDLGLCIVVMSELTREWRNVLIYLCLSAFAYTLPLITPRGR